jgi:N-acetylmuramoyl-L-alanine amidase
MLKNLTLIFLMGPAFASHAQPAKTVILDSGHDVARPGVMTNVGAIGTCGQPEYKYNDDVTAALNGKMKSGYKTILTRQLGKDVDISHLDDSTLRSSLSPKAYARIEKAKTLLGRAAIANAANCDAFVSIHHDSNIPAVVEGKPVCTTDPVTGKVKGGTRLKPEFKQKNKVGFSVLVYEDDQNDPQRVLESRRLAAFIAARMKNDLKRTPSDYHGRNGDCMNADGTPDCRPVNAELGIIHKDVAVLRETRCPAVLVEVGNITDGGPGGDEPQINNPAFREKVAIAIKQGLEDYFRSTPARVTPGQVRPAATRVQR